MTNRPCVHRRDTVLRESLPTCGNTAVRRADLRVSELPRITRPSNSATALPDSRVGLPGRAGPDLHKELLRRDGDYPCVHYARVIRSRRCAWSQPAGRVLTETISDTACSSRSRKRTPAEGIIHSMVPPSSASRPLSRRSTRNEVSHDGATPSCSSSKRRSVRESLSANPVCRMSARNFGSALTSSPAHARHRSVLPRARCDPPGLTGLGSTQLTSRRRCRSLHTVTARCRVLRR